VPAINLADLVFVGPGSEWFWSALSGIVLSITVIALYRQFRLQAHETAIDQLTAFEAEWSSERLNRYKIDVLRELRDGKDPASLSWGPTHSVFNFWERIGSLARGGHLDVEALASVNLGVCQQWWGSLRPWVIARRTEIGPTFGESWEWLAAAVTKVNDRTGTMGMDSLGDLDAFITTLEYRVGIEEAMRSTGVSPAGRATPTGPDGPPRTRSTAATGRSGSSREPGSPGAPSGR
jgi:hypothetical protein